MCASLGDLLLVCLNSPGIHRWCTRPLDQLSVYLSYGSVAGVPVWEICSWPALIKSWRSGRLRVPVGGLPVAVICNQCVCARHLLLLNLPQGSVCWFIYSRDCCWPALITDLLLLGTPQGQRCSWCGAQCEDFAKCIALGSLRGAYPPEGAEEPYHLYWKIYELLSADTAEYSLMLPHVPIAWDA